MQRWPRWRVRFDGVTSNRASGAVVLTGLSISSVPAAITIRLDDLSLQGEGALRDSPALGGQTQALTASIGPIRRPKDETLDLQPLQEAGYVALFNEEMLR